MSTSRRRIGKYSVHLIANESGEKLSAGALQAMMRTTVQRPAVERMHDDSRRNKFVVLDVFQENGALCTGHFKSAKYNHRPPLISKLTLLERDNPKTMEEGESEKTHFGILFRDEDAVLLLESKGGGVRINAMIRYLSLFTPEGTHVDYETLAGPEFLKRLQDMARATKIDVFTNTEIVKTTFGIDRKLPDVRDQVLITFKAKKKMSIITAAKDLYRSLYGGAKKASRLKIYGKSENADDIIIDTEALTDFEYIEVETDQNGQVVTESATYKFKTMLKSYL